jgi:hypothetical protein
VLQAPEDPWAAEAEAEDDESEREDPATAYRETEVVRLQAELARSRRSQQAFERYLELLG